MGQSRVDFDRFLIAIAERGSYNSRVVNGRAAVARRTVILSERVR